MLGDMQKEFWHSVPATETKARAERSPRSRINMTVRAFE